MLKVWEAVGRRISGNFMIVLDYHVRKKVGEGVIELLFRDPATLRRAFISIFGGAAWNLLMKIMVEECVKLGEDPEFVLGWFEEASSRADLY